MMLVWEKKKKKKDAWWRFLSLWTMFLGVDVKELVWDVVREEE